MSYSLNAPSTTVSMSVTFLFTVDDLQSSHHGMERTIVGSASSGELSRRKTSARPSFLNMVPAGLNSQDYHISTLYATQLLIPCIICYLVSYWRQIHAFAMLILNAGVAKTQWYSQWIARKPQTLRASTAARARELDLIHKFLETVKASLAVYLI
jgi:hypothetical protein